MLHRRRLPELGLHVFGAAALLLGVVGLIWGDFATVWQPVRASMPYRSTLAYLFALGLLAAGAAVQSRRSALHGTSALALLYFLAACAWLPRVIGYPQLFGTWSGFAEEFALVMAAVIAWCALATDSPAWAPKVAEVCRVLFGICVVMFGIVHFTALGQTANMVPSWLPPSQRFWAITTGLGHLLAGIAIISGMQAVLASRLLTAMFLSFGALVWLPSLIATPRAHMVWGGNAINLAMAGAAWIVADRLAAQSIARR